MNAVGSAVKNGALSVFTNQTPPPNLKDVVDARPAEYERRVVGFFDDALL